MYKLIAFTPENDIVIKAYVTEQLEAISKLFPELAIEHVNENDNRLALYVKRPDRFPAFLITKNSIRKTSINAKLTNEVLIDWLNSNLG